LLLRGAGFETGPNHLETLGNYASSLVCGHANVTDGMNIPSGASAARCDAVRTPSALCGSASVIGRLAVSGHLSGARFATVPKRLESLDNYGSLFCNGQQKPDTYSGSASIKFPFEFDRGLIAQCRVRSATVIKSQIINHTQFGRFLGFEFFVVELFIFQTAKKSFGRRIVPAIAFAAHALLHTNHRQMLAIFPTRILAAAIRVMQQAGRWLSAPEGHLQGLDTERGPHVVVNRPAHDLAGKQIDHHGDIQPAL